MKSADPAFYAEIGDVINYTITATNTGNATLTSVDVSDKFPDGLDGWTCDADHAGHAGTGEDDRLHRLAHHRRGRHRGRHGLQPGLCRRRRDLHEVCDDETVELSELEIVKEADVDYYAAVGDVINYTITATNTGEIGAHRTSTSPTT